ncbi:MAG: hypothetical protein HDQ87_08125 [Clostridia bacterium]|nr:hypothetical protein [Clostridia bacterium]
MEASPQAIKALEVAAGEAKAAIAAVKDKPMTPVIGRDMMKHLEKLLTLITMAGIKPGE